MGTWKAGTAAISEAAMDVVLESAPDAVVVADPGGRIVYLNARAERLFGYARGELLGRRLETLLPGTLGGGGPHGANEGPEHRTVRRRDGSTFSIHVSLVRVDVEDGPLLAAFVRGASWSRGDEDALPARAAHESGTRLAEAQRIAKIGSWEWDIAEDRVTWSDELYRIYGLEPGEVEVTYQRFLDLVHPDDREFVDGVVREAFQTRAPFSFEHRIVRPDGSERVLHGKGTVTVDDEGAPVRMAGTGHDITERKRIEDALRESEERARQVLETANDAFIEIDASSVITAWNRQAEATFGWSREEAIGRPLVESIMPERYREDHRRGLRRFLATGEGPVLHRRIELSAVHRDGHEFPVELTIWPVKQSGTYRFNAFVHDITERKRAEEALAEAHAELERRAEELQRSNADLEQFANVASHDLQEPLRMVASYVQLLADRYKGRLDSDADDFISFAVDGAERMQALITDLLAYSRAGTVGKSLILMDANEVVRETLALLEGSLRDLGATIEVDPLPAVVADPTLLGQVFRNLVSNAVKFTAPGTAPLVRISADRTEEGWRFSVRDNGIGVEPRYRERIFSPFKRLHGRTAYAGTGIGLAICKRIVERHGGAIWVEDNEEGGSTFTFSVPRQGEAGA